MAREQMGPDGSSPICRSARHRHRVFGAVAAPAEMREPPTGPERNALAHQWHDRCMGKVYPSIDESLKSWLSRQTMFFVGTAPLRGDGNVNVSPKGMAGTFAVLTPSRVAYLDYTGSGTETIAHLRENGRIVLMFCAFDGPPKIVRLHGTGPVS